MEVFASANDVKINYVTMSQLFNKVWCPPVLGYRNLRSFIHDIEIVSVTRDSNAMYAKSGPSRVFGMEDLSSGLGDRCRYPA